MQERVYPHIAQENARRALAVGFHNIALRNQSKKLRDEAVLTLIESQVKLYGKNIVQGAMKALESQMAHKEGGTS